MGAGNRRTGKAPGSASAPSGQQSRTPPRLSPRIHQVTRDHLLAFGPTVAASVGLAIVATLLALSLGSPHSAPEQGAAAAAAQESPAEAKPPLEQDAFGIPPSTEALHGAIAAEGDFEPADRRQQGGAQGTAPLTPVAVAMAHSPDWRPVLETQPIVSRPDLDPDLSPPRANLSSRTGTRPPGEPTASPTPTPIRAITKHRVVEGESVAALAERYHISLETIVRANGLQNPDSLSPGQELLILPFSGLLHVVQDGDTVLDLATRYGVIPEDIVAANRLENPDSLRIGQQLVIPEVPVAVRSAPPAEPQPLSRPLTPVRYEVAQGDTLTAIAQKFGVSVETMVWANPNLANPERLQVGQALVVPPVSGLLHTVVAGDTVNGLAARYSASAAEIIRVNALAEPYVLRLGQVLIVAGGVPPAPTPRPTPTNTPRPPATATPNPAPPAPQPAPQVAMASAQAGSLGQQVVAIAMRYVGYRYVWSGSSPGTGFDCSGLTSYAYRLAGRPIPRDLWGQLNAGPRIARGDLQPGDLVFFQNTYRSGLSHVGIYIGGGRFVHAASEYTGVIVTGLGEAFWNARYVGASRP